VPGVPSQTLSGCFDVKKTAKNWIVSYGWGGRIIRPEDGPHPFGAGHGALKRATAQTDRTRCGATDITGPYTESPRPLSCHLAKNAKARQLAGFVVFGWGGRIRTYEWRDQNPSFYSVFSVSYGIYFVADPLRSPYVPTAATRAATRSIGRSGNPFRSHRRSPKLPLMLPKRRPTDA